MNSRRRVNSAVRRLNFRVGNRDHYVEMLERLFARIEFLNRCAEEVPHVLRLTIHDE